MVRNIHRWSLGLAVTALCLAIGPASADDTEGVVRLGRNPAQDQGVVRVSGAPQTVVRGQSPGGLIPMLFSKANYGCDTRCDLACDVPCAAPYDTGCGAPCVGACDAPCAAPCDQPIACDVGCADSCCDVGGCAPNYCATSVARDDRAGCGCDSCDSCCGSCLFGGSGCGCGGSLGSLCNDNALANWFRINSMVHRSRALTAAANLRQSIDEDCAEKHAWMRCKFGYFVPSGCCGKGCPPMGHYSVVYPVNPSHFDQRDGQVYAAQGYGGPVSVPLAPVVNHTYNYGWGVPSSRLTPVAHPPVAR